MLKGSAWLTFIVLNLVFVALYSRSYARGAIAKIKGNWAKNRCNPLYMPLSDNISKDFMYCVQKAQKSYMGYLLQPLNYLINSLGTIGKSFKLGVFNIRKMFDYIRSQITSIVKGVFVVMMNIVTEFQRIIISTKDLVMKIVGIVKVMTNLVDGGIKTGQSAWNGPPGQITREIAKICFDPTTTVQLDNGTTKQMSHLELGDTLIGGSKIQGVLKLAKNSTDRYYMFKNAGVGNNDIFVTGSHLVLNKDGMYVPVKDHPDSVLCDNKDIDWLSCLITSDHKIRIGSMTFWDWEDDEQRELHGYK